MLSNNYILKKNSSKTRSKKWGKNDGPGMHGEMYIECVLLECVLFVQLAYFCAGALLYLIESPRMIETLSGFFCFFFFAFFVSCKRT